MLITLMAFMGVGTLLWGSNLGWRLVLVFWAAFLFGGLILAAVCGVPRFATVFMGVVALWFVAKAATSHTSLL